MTRPRPADEFTTPAALALRLGCSTRTLQRGEPVRWVVTYADENDPATVERLLPILRRLLACGEAVG